jgi:predicted amidohydrolase YtcJ
MTTTPPELLLTGARIYTADPHRPWAEAILTQGEHIRFVGGEAEARGLAGARCERIHAPGALLVPGLNDSHIHTNTGALSLRMLDLQGVTTVPELQERLRSYAEAHPEREWIEGTALGYEALLADPTPRLALDAAVPDRPVFLRAFDYHSAWVNTAALARAGIARGADIPPPNEVVVDGSGEATGLLKERLATRLITDLIPTLSAEEEAACLAEGMRFLNRMGITSVQNMDGVPARLDQYAGLRERGLLTVRAQHYMTVRETTPRERLDEFAALTLAHTDPWNRVGGIKLFIDGVIESKTALLLEPYADGSGERGLPDLDLDAYRAIVRRADALGMQVVTHAIGDKGVRETLDAYEAAAGANGTSGLRHRIEHIELSHPDDVPRFHRLGVIASMQPLHCAPTSDPNSTPYTALVGPDRLPYAFRWRTLLESGTMLAFGSDWPVVTPDVFHGLHVALTRTNVGGLPVEGYQPQQRITLAQALDAYTRGAAFAEHQEEHKGMLRAGMLADMALFSRDLFRLGPKAILGTEVLLTVVGGRIAHRHDTL